MERHFLQIAYYFPPMPSVASLRMRNVADTAREQFDRVHVISTRNALHFGPVQEADTHNMPTLDYRSIALNQLKREDLHFGGKMTTSAAKQWVGRLMASWPLQFTLGEGGGQYIYWARREAKKIIMAHPVTHIFSSYAPMADHHIASHIKRAHPHLKWIADFRDLPVDGYKKNLLAPQWHLNSYRKLFRKADECWAVSEGQAELLEEQLDSEVQVVPNGLPREYGINTTGFQAGAFRITYTGSLYPHYPYEIFKRGIGLFIRSDNTDLKEIEFHYAGKDGALMQELLQSAGWQGKWVDHGQIPVRESRALQDKSHVNLLFSWHEAKSKGILPAKVYEYLAARRPILGIINGGKDEELNRLIQRYHGRHSEVVYTSEEVRSFLTGQYQAYQSSNAQELLGEPEELKNLYFTADF